MKKPASISSFKKSTYQTAHLFFQRPFYKCSMNDAEAEMYGYDTY